MLLWQRLPRILLLGLPWGSAGLFCSSGSQFFASFWEASETYTDFSSVPFGVFSAASIRFGLVGRHLVFLLPGGVCRRPLVPWIFSGFLHRCPLLGLDLQ